ncbi:unnamed protein product [Cylicocyclus nassatus]|uniref:Uncharacterized protein n=1 Tax=Cylicocyclus nassatus TaxID=53992 RepID=A0AA36H865_CYLNA|nr:unnamed protein product [Cylicocyclus nassatus]
MKLLLLIVASLLAIASTAPQWADDCDCGKEGGKMFKRSPQCFGPDCVGGRCVGPNCWRRGF